MRELLQLLISIDKTLSEHWDKLLLLEADELFNAIFKLTYYDDPDTAICNTPLDALDPL